MSVPTALSDLFFNRDIAHCRILDAEGVLADYDRQALTEEAGHVLRELSALNAYTGGVTAEELVEDFYGRI